MTSISRRIFLMQSGMAAAVTLLPPSARASDPTDLRARLARDPLRPQYHLMPAANWMNDPNGPIFYKGRYHMFLQYNPNASVWGDMHWAHSSSPDMIHWEHEPVAIAPTPNGWDRDGVFSGCIVLDGATPAAIYTGVLPPDMPADATLKDGQHTWREVQCLAHSHDADLRTWQKLPDPIIARPPAGLTVTGFRDPCVWREGNEWRMALGSGFAGKGGAILLYRSHDLGQWTYLNPLVEGHSTGQAGTNPVDTGDMWECPDFFPLGDRHVLLISTMGKVLWKAGHYDGKRFTTDKEGVVDYGAYYAERSMLDRDGKRVLWGWIPERRPEAEHRAAGWAGAMSLPRVLSLAPDGQLEMLPAPAVEMLRGKSTSIRADEPDAKKKLDAMRIHDLAAELHVECVPDRLFTLELKSDGGARFAEVAYDPAATGSELRINNTRAAVTAPKNQALHLRLFVDASVLELFANRTTAITERIYIAPQGALRISASDMSSLRSLGLWPIQPISKDRLTS
jgi:beta-fructofuranosidase